MPAHQRRVGARMPKTKTRSGNAAEADNRAAEAWAAANHDAVIRALASDAAGEAIRAAVDAFHAAGKDDKARTLDQAWHVAATSAGIALAAIEGRILAVGGSRPRLSVAQVWELVGVPFIPVLQQTAAGGGRHALALVHRLQPKPANLKRPDPIFPRITFGAVNPARERGELLLAPDGWPGLRASALPLFPEVADDDAIVPLLELATVTTGDRAVSSGRGAAHELRLVFEALTALSHGGYTGGVPVAYTVEDLLRAFYRGGTASMYRSGDRPGDWAQIRAACEWIDRAALPWRVPSGNMQSWFLMRLRTLPGERPARSDPVVFEVALPPGSEDGPAVNRRALREAGRVSSPAFRIGIAVPTLTWVPGRTRRPVKSRRGQWVQGPGGLWIGDASRYPVLSLRDRRRIAFGRDATHSTARVDAAWWKAADADGVVILETDAVERSGKRGWRVVPKAAAEAIRTARKKSRQG